MKNKNIQTQIKRAMRSKYTPHFGTKQLAKKLAAKLVTDCIGKTPEEANVLEAAFLAKITTTSHDGPTLESNDA